MNHEESTYLKGEGQTDHQARSEQPGVTSGFDSAAHGIGEDAGMDGARGDEPTLGDRLRRAREQHGMSLPDCAQALRLPTRLLEKLEADDYEGIDYSVYLKGYLRKYAAHVRLDLSHVETRIESLQARQPVLVASQSQSAWKRGMQRYSSAATGIVLTAVIVVPLIWLGLHGVLKRDIARLAPLNSAPVSGASSQLAEGAPTNAGGQDLAIPPAEAGGTAKPPGATEQKPLMASMAPFSAMEGTRSGTDSGSGDTGSAAAPVDATATPTSATGTPTHLSITLKQPSWVEITDDSGTRLEYALLPAGTRRAYASKAPLDVRIGNADGATVQVDGQSLQLQPFRRANVAHFELGRDGQARVGTD